jgi:hypothetical protein
MLVGKRGGLYSLDLSSSDFCLVPPGGDGWSSRVDDAVRHGCIPVIIMDGVKMPFEGLLDYSAFAVRVAEADVEKLDDILRAVPPARKDAMRAAMRTLWTRFTYALALLRPDAWLPRPDLPRDYLSKPPLPALARHMAAAAGGGHAGPPPPQGALLPAPAADGLAAPDALDTVMMFLASRAGVGGKG